VLNFPILNTGTIKRKVTTPLFERTGSGKVHWQTNLRLRWCLQGVLSYDINMTI